jgi:hypothetical protein
VTGLDLAITIAVTTVAVLLLWTAMVRVQTRIAPTVPEGMTTRLCDSVTCRRPVPHVVMPCGAALCTRCGTESPTPYQTP